MNRLFHRSPSARALPLLLTLCACTFTADYSGTQYRCAESDACPPGLSCVNDICRVDGVEGGECGTLSMAANDFSTDIDFDDFDWDSHWDFFETNSGYLSTRDGQLVMEIPSSDSDVGAEFSSEKIFAIAGATTTIEIVERNSQPGTGVYFVITDIEGDHVELYEEAGLLYVVYHSSTEETVLDSRPFDSETHRFWRMREQGGVVHFETSPDGSRFVEHATTELREVGAWVSVLIGIWQWNTTTDTTRFVVDNLNNDGADIPFCPISYIQDDFDDGTRSDDWELVRDGDCQGYELDGRLVFQFPDNESSECYYASRTRYDLRQSTISVEAPLRDIAGLEQCLKLKMPNGDDIEFELWDGRLAGEASIDGNTIQTFTAQFDPVAHRYWRFRGAGDTVFWEVSPDRQEWQVQGSYQAPEFDISDIHVRLIGDTNVGGMDNQGSGFDNLNIEPN